jgi:hypothetical protein
MKFFAGMIFAAALCAAPHAATAQTPTSSKNIVTGSGLVCDTKEQAERFVSLMSDDVEKTLLTVNNEAGDAHACIVATIGFIPGSKVGEVNKDGTIVHVIEVQVVAVATHRGMRMVEPKTYYSVIATKERSV